MSRMNDELRETVHRLILEAVEKYGPSFKAAALYREVQARGLEVNRRTFYRWVADIRHGYGAVPAFLPVKRNPGGRRFKPVASPGRSMDFESTSSAKTPTAARIDFLSKMAESLGRSERMAEYASEMIGPVGQQRPRSPKLWGMAERNVQGALGIAASHQSALMDITKIRAFHKVLFDRISTRDPELVAEILVDVRELAREWGLGESGFV